MPSRRARMKDLKAILAHRVIVTCMGISHIIAAAAGGWQTVRLQSPDASGTGSYPSIRYGHTCHSYKGELLTTHGYYYDRQHAIPTWLSDTWAMGAADGYYAWHRLSNHFPQAEAFDSYSSGRTPRAPCGRFGHVSAIIDDALLLYGGNDGGYSRTNRDDYRPGHDFDDLWRFNFTNRTWSLLRPGGGGPGKRHMAGAAAVRDKFILYGGMGRDRGDVWSYSPAENRWELLSEAVPLEQGGPGARCGHTMLPWITGLAYGVLMYGGQSQLPNGSYTVHDDAWFFDISTRRWRKLQLAPEAETAAPHHGAAAPLAPAGHFYSAAMVTSVTLPASAVAAAAVAAAGGGKKSCHQDPAGGSFSSLSASISADEAKPSQSRHSPAADAGAAAADRAPVRLRVGVIAGGSTTTPGLTCSSQAWAFTTDCAVISIIWTRLPDLPAALYDTRGAAVGGAAYVFGGHLCHLERPPLPPYQYYYVNEVQRLDLGLGLDLDLDLDLEHGVSPGSSSGVVALLRGGVGEGDGTAAAAACALRDKGTAATGGGQVAARPPRKGPPVRGEWGPAAAGPPNDEL